MTKPTYLKVESAICRSTCCTTVCGGVFVFARIKEGLGSHHLGVIIITKGFLGDGSYSLSMLRIFYIKIHFITNVYKFA